MTIAQRVAEYQSPRIGGRCRTCSLIADLPKEESEALIGALADERISNSGLAQILRAEGFPIAETTIRRHRKGECKGDN